MGSLFRLREALRSRPAVGNSIYSAQNLYFRAFPRVPRITGQGSGIALCLRFRNEARYLDEWLEYHQAAGVDHFFLYNNFSEDNFGPVVKRHPVTLIDWPRVPATPFAEEDCIRRTAGRFEWVGFLDADEFVVIRDGRTIGAFLSGFSESAVALHWHMYGSSGHKMRPNRPVIEAYQHRAPAPNRHVKVFVRLETVTACRNPHAFFYRRGVAVNESHMPVKGSFGYSPTASEAWINHYHVKSEEDYRAKMEMGVLQDKTGMKHPPRRPERMAADLVKNNEVYDPCALEYFRAMQSRQLAK